ncbi:MAG TPA: cell wall-binding repeat-containing protein, partial [Acidimicrobiales bacterium]|nr:cell wall-binding repeat-containing protein [Acidimicrobiales bacterium]
MRRLLAGMLVIVLASCGGGDDGGTLAERVAEAQGARSDAVVRRIAGADPYDTAAAIALDEYASASDPILANGDDPADALAGSYLAATHGSALLLTRRDELPQSTIDALASLRARKVHVLGGPAAIGEGVAAELTSLGYVVNRVAGPDRYATAVAVAEEEGTAILGIWPGEGRTVFLANGLRPSDALSAGPIANGQLLPILLTATDELPVVTSSALDRLAVEHVIVLGGTAAVSDAVVASIEAGGRSVRRVAGVDRTSTATAVADL